MGTTSEAAFSDLINKPKDTVAKLNRTPGQSLRLRRRDDEDLMLTTAERAEQDGEVMTATTRMFVALMSKDAAARALLTEVVPEAFPWVRFLSTEGVREFVVELVETLKAVGDLGNTAAVAQVIVEWRHTAEVQSDPELMRILTQEHGDFGPVPRPGAAE